MPDKKPLITLTSDFGIQSQSVGVMEAVALGIAPEANVVHLMHGLPAFNILAAARTLEAVHTIPVGVHVCICDPGVGTNRRAVLCSTVRGDTLIGPDNGVLLPAARMLGGIEFAVEIVNPNFMRHPVSPIFHGRDIFVPAAAHLAGGTPPDLLGPRIDPQGLAPSPYEEAVVNTRNEVRATIIQINRYGSIHLNILHTVWDSLDVDRGTSLRMLLPNDQAVELIFCRTFGDVPPGRLLILKDDYGRVEVAKNLGSFVQDHSVSIGDTVVLHL
jgi:S-adenosyl-L-methionine hydrolase (adenosine-forming)